LNEGCNYLDPNRLDAVRLSVAEARALGEDDAEAAGETVL